MSCMVRCLSLALACRRRLLNRAAGAVCNPVPRTRKCGSGPGGTKKDFMPLEAFHPVIQRWFLGRFQAPTEPQRQGWPPIAAGMNTLIAAPTGSGKTLTAFLAAIDRLLK